MSSRSDTNVTPEILFQEGIITYDRHMQPQIYAGTGRGYRTLDVTHWDEAKKGGGKGIRPIMKKSMDKYSQGGNYMLVTTKDRSILLSGNIGQSPGNNRLRLVMVSKKGERFSMQYHRSGNVHRMPTVSVY